MNFVEPQYTPQEVNRAGRILREHRSEEFNPRDHPNFVDDAIDSYVIVNNWRASHHRPLNTFAMTLRNRARRISNHVIVAQRIKRLESIALKLSREPTMRLSQMQDIAGCRVVMPTVAAARNLVQQYADASDFSHVLRSQKDYISEPKESGYRGVHLIYQYKLREHSPHEGQRVEIQVRTQLQHTWATAVEAAGTFTNQALKSSQGSDDWKRFFCLMGSYFARRERCPAVPGTPQSMRDLRAEIRELAKSLHVIGILGAYSATIHRVGKMARMKYYLMELDPDERSVQLQAFTAAETKEANDAYTAVEKMIPVGSSRQAVLVSVDSVAALQQAYPNYFLDTTRFANLVEYATSPRNQ